MYFSLYSKGAFFVNIILFVSLLFSLCFLSYSCIAYFQFRAGKKKEFTRKDIANLRLYSPMLTLYSTSAYIIMAVDDLLIKVIFYIYIIGMTIFLFKMKKKWKEPKRKDNDYFFKTLYMFLINTVFLIVIILNMLGVPIS